MSPAPQPTRRAVLAAGLAALTAGCTDEAPPRPVPVDPDDVLRAEAAERERALLREYDAVMLVLPDLAGRLVGLRAHHVEHLAALAGPPPSVTPAATASPSAGPGPAVPPPATAAAALAGLAAAERAASQAHAQACLAAREADLAALLASLSASELSHPVALA